jgi:hypothetical protein
MEAKFLLQLRFHNTATEQRTKTETEITQHGVITPLPKPG